MASRLEPPAGYTVVRLADIRRYVCLKLERNRAGELLALKPLINPDTLCVRTYRKRAQAVLELTVAVQALELEQLRAEAASASASTRARERERYAATG